MAEISQAEIKELLANQRTVITQNKKLIEENALLRKEREEGTGVSRILRKVTDRFVELRLVDNKAVIGYKNKSVSQDRPVYIYDKADPKNPKETLQYVDLILEDGSVLPIDFKEFRAESLRVKCKVVNTEQKEWIINQGIVKKKEIEEYSSVELDFDVPLDVVGVTRFFTVQVPEGHGEPRELKVHENYVNIA